MKDLSQLIEILKQQGIRDQRVLDALRRVDRKLFVPNHLKSRAYENTALPIGEEQTISQPYIVALMTQALELQGDEKVLEIGTGSGYQTAILAELAKEVYSMERIESLQNSAKERIKADQMHFITGDGTLGYPQKAPYDAIIVTAQAPKVPKPLLEQLEGKMIIPVRNDLVLIDTIKDTKEIIEQVRFVRLVGKEGYERL